MKAVLTVGHGARDRLQLDENFPDPQAARDEVLLRVAATAVNYHDIFTRRGMPGIRIPLPVIVGSAIAGEVVAVGAGGHAWKPGDPVLVVPEFADGQRTVKLEVTTHGRRAPIIAVAADQLIALPQE